MAGDLLQGVPLVWLQPGTQRRQTVLLVRALELTQRLARLVPEGGGR